MTANFASLKKDPHGASNSTTWIDDRSAAQADILRLQNHCRNTKNQRDTVHFRWENESFWRTHFAPNSCRTILPLQHTFTRNVIYAHGKYVQPTFGFKPIAAPIIRMDRVVIIIMNQCQDVQVRGVVSCRSFFWWCVSLVNAIPCRQIRKGLRLTQVHYFCKLWDLKSPVFCFNSSAW